MTRSPAARVRELVREAAGDAIADRLSDGYQRLGRVLVIRVPSECRPAEAAIGRAWQEVLGVETVLARDGPVGGDLRRPSLRRIAGGPTETEVLEHGVRFRFDAERILFARGNREERHRFGGLIRPGEAVADLFAGIGYFTLPALVLGRPSIVHAVEKNPLSYRYLEENLRLNRVEGPARVHLGDNRDAPLPDGAFDRIVLGYLPSSLPWLPRAVRLLAPSGGILHVHLAAPTRPGIAGAESETRRAIEREGATVRSAIGREVKPYGPGRFHVVVDAEVRPPTRAWRSDGRP